MKYVFIFFGLFSSAISNSQIITTWAGNGIASNTGDGNLATTATIDFPATGVFDRLGNYYLTTGYNGNTIRKISTTGIITTIAGTNGVSGYGGDNESATLAQLNNPQGITIDAIGNLYFTDQGNSRVRKINASTGFITTIAGNGGLGYGGDGGPATLAEFYDPLGICVDSKGNIYVADFFNNRIRKINNLGMISTVAGTGVAGFNGDGGLADTSMIRGGEFVCMDKEDNLYISDEGNGRVRKVDTFGFIHTVAGNGVVGYSGNGGLATNAELSPSSIQIDKYGNLYILEYVYYVIQMVNHTTGIINIAIGNGISGFNGDGGPATAAEFDMVDAGMAFDSCNNMYVCDLNNYRIRKVTYPHCNYLETENIETAPNTLSLYPNPAYSSLTITANEKMEHIEVVNTLGQTVYSSYELGVMNYELSVEDWLPGVYFVYVNRKYWGKVVKG